MSSSRIKKKGRKNALDIFEPLVVSIASLQRSVKLKPAEQFPRS